jgi:lipopolysaccharide/colanic/teichoic acid biosynthesis glycosyltransferase
MANRKFYDHFGRWVDFTVALFGLAVAAPLFGLVAAAIAADSGRPIFYKGIRVGRGGKLFQMAKFRTMVQEADRLGSSVTRDSDRRVTRVGRFLRRWKLDELPQLWNVLKGEMSLVGPRPDAPEIIQNYSIAMRRALEVRPGMTSVASLWLRNETDLLRGLQAPDEVYEKIIVPAKVRLALTHLDRRSLLFDWKVLLATISAWLGVRPRTRAEREFLAGLRQQIAAHAAGAGESLAKQRDEKGLENPQEAGDGSRMQRR